jgi:hypothetical protein
MGIEDLVFFFFLLIVGTAVFFVLGFAIGRWYGQKEMNLVVNEYKNAIHAWQDRAIKEKW